MENTIGPYKVSAILNGGSSVNIRVEHSETKAVFERRFGPEDFSEYKRFGGIDFIVNLLRSSKDKIAITYFTNEIWLESYVLYELHNSPCTIKNIRLMLPIVVAAKAEPQQNPTIEELLKKVALLEEKVAKLEALQEKKNDNPNILGWRPPTC